ncbi:hypothetical protein [Fructobacillus cardui]|uniref:hypothetical protein n=1 Tax=Fructobacillus cardui TaxID=2893170 RepID=UPI002009F857|nr:hypothetical protein [Fructobacillus cardui]MCK8628130.1 hypothetical protein [Fructobacillus cardui]
MDNEIDLTVNKINRQIEPLFRKERNTLYHFRVVGTPFTEKYNIFFEWHKINHSTISRQVGSYSKRNSKYIDEFVQSLERATGVSVQLLLQ